MTDDMIPVPRELLAVLRSYAQSAGASGAVAHIDSAMRAALAPRLRIVNLDEPDGIDMEHLWRVANNRERNGDSSLAALLARIDGAGDPMTVIEQAIHQWDPFEESAASLIARIRAPLEGAAS